MNKKLLVVALSFAALSNTAWAQNPFGNSGMGGLPPIDEKTQSAFQECAKKSGLPAPGAGSRPTREQHEKFKACLKTKGITLPAHPAPPDYESEDSE